MSSAGPTKNTDQDLALKFARLKCDSDPEAYIWEYRNLHLALGLSDAANTSPKGDLVMGAIFVSNLPEPVQKRMDMSLLGNMTDLIWEAFQASETEREWQRFKEIHPDAVEEDDDESMAASDVEDIASTRTSSPVLPSVPSTPKETVVSTPEIPQEIPMVGTPTTPNMNIPQATSRNVSSGSGHNVPVVASSATTSPNNSSSQAEGIYQPKFRQTHSRSASQSVISTTPLSELGNTSMNGNNGGGPRRIESRHKRSQSNAKPAANAAPAPVSNVTYGGVGVGQIPSFSPATGANTTDFAPSRSRAASIVSNGGNGGSGGNQGERKPSSAKRPNGKFTHTGRLTSKEKTRRQEKGLCLYCAKPGHARPQCPVLHEKASAGTRNLKQRAC
ncbi:hypothetical protein B0I72DRAFT_135929 [Yarrowia lipolytica]|jgi:hypothetical protein|uniref:YALI0D04136p n=2 Tax=Yarrowia lipolytica TaxID=4952 RepID=Q6CAC1_YARLI|nr:YALI0D04136p [Yarrowia lipolytica CLIB122]AOW03557.1 hypothetical protein YALI1_D05195g [Yarrowia lipolytica]KAB8284672.1 hypothetical protein BKA91DRAFT_134685 [Yarrowia lipolytica]KAE8171297.1 hypothetical protein BKA90DRAFT_139322 [Yarrowia lipolytica]KAJ8054815.1 hypothetical protein LXG23DRAFT_49059 [Yarrowia lipolytica]QNP98606.1 Hypothetical protein YALI2_D01047g [Yarrowia lipolytica]|eukprot:XP_502391.1 YALI0D04136p [Yarrowia lipolytica CLIB122]